MSLREDALKERVEAVRPKVARAREIAELADSESREMTAKEKKTFDEFMAHGGCPAVPGCGSPPCHFSLAVAGMDGCYDISDLRPRAGYRTAAGRAVMATA